MSGRDKAYENLVCFITEALERQLGRVPSYRVDAICVQPFMAENSDEPLCIWARVENDGMWHDFVIGLKKTEGA